MFVSHTLQNVIAIFVLQHGLISFLLKVKVNPNPRRKLTLGKQLTPLFAYIVFMQTFQIGNAILQSCEKDFFLLNVSEYRN